MRAQLYSLLPLMMVSTAGAEIDFAHQVVPILREHCAKCHMGDARKGGLSMNTRELMLEGSENGEIVEPGNAEHSLLLEVVMSDDRVDRMPPKGERVPEAEVEILRRWIDEGAVWEPGFTFGEEAYEPPLKPRNPELPAAVAGREHGVDRFVDRYFSENDVKRPGRVSDAGFIRRLTLDLTGLLPEPDDVVSFVADKRPDKRQRLIGEVLARDVEYAEHWLTFWNDLLRNDYQGTGYIDGGRSAITRWLYGSLLENKAYDVFARELLAPPTEESQGFIGGIQWRGSVNASQTREVQFAQSISQTFLGLNMKCASCHDSFTDRWKLDEAYGLAAIYAESPLEIARCDKPTGRMAKAAWIFPELGEVDADAPREERLAQLAALMTHPENGRFTRTIVNRLWHRMMGRGLVHPVDAMDTKPWNEDLLDHLAARFAEDGHDMKKALAYIASSEIYQAEVVVTPEGGNDGIFRGPMAKRLTAEQFVDAVWTLTGTAPASAHPSVPRGVAAGGESLQARWIWSYAASGSSPAGEAVVLGTEVVLAEEPVMVRAAFIADNEAEIFVNGKLAARENGEAGSPRVQAVMMPQFRSGKNTIIAVARNGGASPNPAGFIFEARAEFESGEVVVIASGDAWKWTATMPAADGSFVQAPMDWQQAALVADPQVWDRFSQGMSGHLEPGGRRMVRASVVPSDMLMRALGRPNREQIVSMRPEEMTTLEAIDLANGEQLAGLLQQGAAMLRGQGLPMEALVDDVFAKALSRRPSGEEKAGLLALLGEGAGQQQVEDLLWLVLMLPEFQFVR